MPLTTEPSLQPQFSLSNSEEEAAATDDDNEDDEDDDDNKQALDTLGLTDSLSTLLPRSCG